MEGERRREEELGDVFFFGGGQDRLFLPERSARVKREDFEPRRRGGGFFLSFHRPGREEKKITKRRERRGGSSNYLIMGDRGERKIGSLWGEKERRSDFFLKYRGGGKEKRGGVQGGKNFRAGEEERGGEWSCESSSLLIMCERGVGEGGEEVSFLSRDRGRGRVGRKHPLNIFFINWGRGNESRKRGENFTSLLYTLKRGKGE